MCLHYLAAGAACLRRRAAQTLRGQAREMRRLLKIDLTARELFLHVRREVEYLKILADEAVQGDSPGCFTLKEGADVAGGTYKVFPPPL
jgi:hypothetical protein